MQPRLPKLDNVCDVAREDGRAEAPAEVLDGSTNSQHPRRDTRNQQRELAVKRKERVSGLYGGPRTHPQ